MLSYFFFYFLFQGYSCSYAFSLIEPQKLLTDLDQVNWRAMVLVHHQSICLVNAYPATL